MIRIFSDMDRYIQDYKVQRQMAEDKKVFNHYQM